LGQSDELAAPGREDAENHHHPGDDSAPPQMALEEQLAVAQA
jgi:hypothetical protein